MCILQLDNNRANVSELKQYESKVEEEAYEEAEEEEEEDEVQVQVSLKLCSGRVACEREEREGGWRRPWSDRSVRYCYSLVLLSLIHVD